MEAEGSGGIVEAEGTVESAGSSFRGTPTLGEGSGISFEGMSLGAIRDAWVAFGKKYGIYGLEKKKIRLCSLKRVAKQVAKQHEERKRRRE